MIRRPSDANEITWGNSLAWSPLACGSIFFARPRVQRGVADVVEGWDQQVQQRSGLDEVPLLWMDRALSKYRGIESPGAWVEDGLELAAVAREQEGLWVGLWHPNLTMALGYPDSPEAFAELLRRLDDQKPHWGSVRDIVAWRRARRSAIVRGVRPDGSVDVAVADDVSWPVTLEDQDGVVREVASRG
jgi:hypothetical protein